MFQYLENPPGAGWFSPLPMLYMMVNYLYKLSVKKIAKAVVPLKMRKNFLFMVKEYNYEFN